MYIYRAFQFFIRELRFGIWGDVNSWIGRAYRKVLVNQMKRLLFPKGRPDLVPKLIPKVVPGCKRIGVSDDYLQALCEDNVTVNCSPIEKIEGRTIITKDGTEAEVDVLCLATGFNVNGFLGHLQVYGRNGVSLNKLWDEESAKTYKTVNVHGFPNFFIMLGPGSGLGHNSVVTTIEW
jgi:cation diffusion facilitator CzcD-associated flavoprotein CzcO